MALTKCKECGNEVSSKAETCPKCGARVSARPKSFTSLAGIAVVGTVGLVSLYSIFSPSRPTLQTPQQIPATSKQDEAVQVTPAPPSLDVLTSDFDARLHQLDWQSARDAAEEIVLYYPQSEAGRKAAAALPEIDAQIIAAVQKAAIEERMRRKRLLSSLQRSRDNVEGVTFYYAPETPLHAVANYWALYIGAPDHGVAYLRFRFMYTGETWLFIQGMTLNVDGQKLPDAPLNYFAVKRDNGAESVWEWYDEPVDEKSLGFFGTLAKSQKTVIRYEGTQYSKDRILSNAEKRGMRKVLDVYRALLNGAWLSQPCPLPKERLGNFTG